MTGPFKGTVLVGKIDSGHSVLADVTVEIEYDGSELSFVGDVKRPGARDVDSCGQIRDRVAAVKESHLSISPEMRDRLILLWERWHLNAMRSGCEHQRAEGWAERPIDPSAPLESYGRHFPGQRQDSWNMLTWVWPSEHPNGLLTAPCPTCGYRFGTAWLKEDVPDEVLEELKGILGGVWTPLEA